MSDEINDLKRQAEAALARIRAELTAGNFNLSPTIRKAVSEDTAEEIEAITDIYPDSTLNQILKGKGLSRRDRRAYLSRTRDRAPIKPPAHTVRAQKIADRQAVERARKAGRSLGKTEAVTGFVKAGLAS